MEDRNVTGKVIGGILIGTIVGAALGILFAPMDGSKTRKKIATGAKDLTDNLVSRVKSKASDVTERVEDMGSKAEEKFDTMKNNVGTRQSY